MNHKKRLMIVCFVLTCSAHALATTYHISPSGNDSTGDGSYANRGKQPRKLLRKVTALVQGWVSGTVVNNGFVVRSPTSGVKPLFYSSGYSANTALRPKLTVTY